MEPTTEGRDHYQAVFLRQLAGVLERPPTVLLDSVGVGDHELRQTWLAQSES